MPILIRDFFDSKKTFSYYCKLNIIPRGGEEAQVRAKGGLPLVYRYTNWCHCVLNTIYRINGKKHAQTFSRAHSKYSQ